MKRKRERRKEEGTERNGKEQIKKLRKLRKGGKQKQKMLNESKGN